jgi:ATP-dependent helicase/nuclease subunit A
MTSSLTVYRASAGSGKTFNLVLQYLTIALRRPYEFKNTLAITFTNKATEEFKRKLFRYLHSISTGSNTENVTAMVNELRQNGLDEKTIKQNSPVLLSAMLHNFSDISIMTIDAFFSRILKSFSLELDLNIGNEIEINTPRVLNEIINDFLNNLEENQFETEILQKFLLKNISEAKSRNIERQILSVSKEIFKDRYNILHNNPVVNKDEKTYLDFINSLENYKNRFEQELITLCRDAIAFMESHNLSEKDFRKSFIKYINKQHKDFHKNDFEIADTFFKVLEENST